MDHEALCYDFIFDKRGAFMEIINKANSFVGKNLTYIVIITVIMAFIKPQTFAWAAPHTVALLSIIMFGMGMTLTANNFKSIFSQPRQVLVGCMLHYTIMPLIAYALTIIFRLPAELAVGMILLGSCPSGTASNVMSYLAKGDVPLAVCITSVSTLLAPILTPMLTWAMAGQWITVSFTAMLLSVVKMIIAPIILGLLFHRIVGHTVVIKFSKILVLLSAFSVLTIVGSLVALNGSQLIEVGLILVLIVLIHNLCGFAIAYVLTGVLDLGLPQRHTVTLEVGMQNDALACSLATIHFTPTVAIPGVIGAVVHQMTGSMLATIFASLMDKKKESVHESLSITTAPSQQ